jgi:uncharacterized membrane protein
LRILELLTIELKVLIVAAIPIIELRGAIPMGIALGMSPLHAFIISYFGSLLPVPIIVFAFRPVVEWLKKTVLKDIVEKVSNRALNKGQRIQKYGFVGLILLVAIPLPGTGVYTGTLAATLLNMRFKWILPAVMIGNLIAGLIVLFVSQGVISV